MQNARVRRCALLATLLSFSASVVTTSLYAGEPSVIRSTGIEELDEVIARNTSSIVEPAPVFTSAFIRVRTEEAIAKFLDDKEEIETSGNVSARIHLISPDLGDPPVLVETTRMLREVCVTARDTNLDTRTAASSIGRLLASLSETERAEKETFYRGYAEKASPQEQEKLWAAVQQQPAQVTTARIDFIGVSTEAGDSLVKVLRKSCSNQQVTGGLGI